MNDFGSGFGHHPDDDELVGFLRSADPGEPPVTLGPGSALRHRAAARHARRQAIGAGLAVALIGIAVAGSVVGTRHHSATTASNQHLPVTSPSITDTADVSAVPSKSPSAAPATQPATVISAPTAPTRSETAEPHTQVSPSIPHVVSASLRPLGSVSVGQLVTLTVRATWAGTTFVPGINRVDYGDGFTNETIASCLPSSSYGSDDRTASSSGELAPDTHTYKAPGTYTVHLWVGYLCGPHASDYEVTGTVVVVGPTGPSESSSASAAPASPSPSASPSAPASDSPSPTP
ncbi:MAG TPA: hypothetical protein VHE83_01365 [Mycobacteriales bacterium]|nr:hypothetical protein [Mycobacteriales bacterium]